MKVNNATEMKGKSGGAHEAEYDRERAIARRSGFLCPYTTLLYPPTCGNRIRVEVIRACCHTRAPYHPHVTPHRRLPPPPSLPQARALANEDCPFLHADSISTLAASNFSRTPLAFVFLILSLSPSLSRAFD